MKLRMTWAIGLMLLVLTSCDKPVAKDPVQQMIRAEVIAVAGNLLTVHPLGRGVPDRLEIAADGKTVVTAPQTQLDEASGRMLTIPIVLQLADIHAADFVAVSTRDGVAVSINVTPATVQGELVRAGDGTISVKTKGAGQDRTEKTFQIVPGKTVIAWPDADRETFEPRQLSELQGEQVVVSAMGGIAQTVFRVPPVPVQGRVVRVDGNSITLTPTTRPGEPAKADQRFATDSAHTAFFEMYLGLTPERVALRDIRAEQAVTVIAKNGVAESVTIVHSPIHRRLISIEKDAMVVNRNPQTPNEQFRFGPSTRFMIAKVTNTFTGPTGKPGYGYTYVDAKQADLKPGDDLSITAKGSVALEVRRSFRRDQVAAK